MKRKATLGIALVIAAAAPSVLAPRVVHAQDAANPAPAEYPDVPRGQWANQALNKLSQIGVIEGLPNGNYYGNKPMTRYEFAVAIARLLDRIPSLPAVVAGERFDNSENERRLTALEGRPIPDITKAEVNDLIGSLRREFADELARLGVRLDAVENRLTNLENRVTAPQRMTLSASLLARQGTADYISQVGVAGRPGIFGAANPGRTIVNGNNTNNLLPRPPYTAFPSQRERVANEKYSYTDFELRLTDRVTDRLNVVGALRSLGSTQEDPWAGNSGSNTYVREAYATADLSDRSFIGIKGLKATIGRQPTKIGQGLLYDNDLQPTDQIRGDFNIGPVALTGFIGSNNNQTVTSYGNNSQNGTGGGNNNNQNGNGGVNPYLGSGAVRFLGLNGDNGLANRPGTTQSRSGAFVGFGQATSYQDDNESAVRAGFNLFRLAGQPVSLGITRMFDGVANQRGDSADLTIPLFNRTIGVEYVRQRAYLGERATTNPHAYNVTVPLFRARVLDLDFAYGKAGDAFEFFAASSANPFARTYAEALFDRPLALGAPLINGRFFNTGAKLNGAVPSYAAAKEAYDFTGKLRVLKRLPLEFRYYRAYGSKLAGPPGGHKNALDLGAVYSVGSTFNVSPGLDLELKYGNYNVPGPTRSIQYVRVGANVGF